MPVKSSSRKAKPKFKVGDTVPVVRFNNGREPQAAIVIYIEQSDEDETYFEGVPEFFEEKETKEEDNSYPDVLVPVRSKDQE